MKQLHETVRVHAGLYVSGDGRYRIRRVKDELRKRWVWHVSVLDAGQYVYDQKFNTLKVARAYVEDRVWKYTMCW